MHRYKFDLLFCIKDYFITFMNKLSVKQTSTWVSMLSVTLT